MPTCPDCMATYKRSHSTCKAGTCETCMVSFKNIEAHRCPIRKVLTLDLIEVWARLNGTHQKGVSCQACNTKYFLHTNVHGFRKFCGVNLCWNCYTIPEITQHVQETRLKLMEHDARDGKWTCSLCACILFDPVTFQPHQAFERDHIDEFTKVCTVWELLVSGASFDRVVHENDKCRNLCIRCHSAVTSAERAVGILRLKNLRSPCISTYTRRRALYQVESLTNMLLSRDIE